MSQRDRQRIQVHIVQIRAQDVLPGDVVNRSGPLRDGWIDMSYIEQLPDGRLNLCDESYRKSFVSEPLDLVWLQIAVNLKGNSHIPVDIPMHHEPVPVQAALPAGRATEVEGHAGPAQA
ncbi:MAG: hypothetical protein F2754_12795 [Actinobacteria bacterium]|uniref:Unannotated protein n=1 Tax=freshwater metagenome TaxID=449393 RepID=A0A6J7N9X1_9ZZZZ|nr:hypothetical protein [Actinomycetota bacterium]MSW90709.1 hypothetical protein [Actinomycetota bacterium]MSX88254.1 hypothetical protein [Actinomycetota bacterium]MSY71033.1 hypothetical protein [Actinomycetota bacterium]